jgi:hypothetical protein
VGGALFWALHSGTAFTRAVAYGLWFAAAGCLLLMVVVGSRLIWRRTSFPTPEGWVFVTAAIVLSGLGAAIDAVG